MKFAAVVLALLPAFVLADTVSYDTVYDKGSNSLDLVACSDGENGLETRYGWKTFSDVKGFPHIAAVAAITGWNSESCGSCWNVTYTNGNKVSKSITLLGLDVSGGGFVVGQKTMDELTGGQAVKLGRVTVTSKQLKASACGL